MKNLMTKMMIGCGVLLSLTGSAFAAQSATGPVTFWSVSTMPGFSLISVGGSGDGGGSSVLCSVDANSNFGSTVMTSAASAAAQGSDVTLQCSDAGQVLQMQLPVAAD